MISALIVDDEALARGKLRRMLGDQADVRIVGEARSGREAIAMIRTARPDIVFLDVDMPDRTGFEVIEEVGMQDLPLVVFVTAHDAYAVRAFEVHAVDYLLKPFQPQRLRSALDRAQARRLGREVGTAESLGALLTAIRMRNAEPAPARPGRAFPERLVVPERGEMQFIPVEDLDWIEAADNYVQLHAGGRTFLLRETLAAMEERLDPDRFTRIHRGAIVNDRKVRAVRPMGGGELQAVMIDGTALPVGRSYRLQVTSKWQMA